MQPVKHCADCESVTTNDPEASFCQSCFSDLCGACASPYCMECERTRAAHPSRTLRLT